MLYLNTIGVSSIVPNDNGIAFVGKRGWSEAK